ncbi:uncharacterized protein FIBRA_03042 [Fibroporia radiculosa]|uniref:Cytochrome P450 n=1 Tax=Fibroporia radiculosa TaxID=599839 RepID=J4H267_9APHY|nr:uncharacterized protein FIBRA_03042 [Fibroporia radiculosa]CCM00994.1 predicted protein [Fibroporia radiculosa]
MLTFYFLCLTGLWFVYDRLILSPLGKLRGPNLAAATRLVLMYYEFTGRRREWIHALHMKYGPVVRIAPDEVSFATWDAVKEIYVTDGSGYDKPPFYRLFDNYRTQCMFSTLGKGPHGERKKLFAEKYSKSYIMQPHTVSGIQERAEQFVEKCTENLGAAADIYFYAHCYALDCITYHLFDPYGTRSLTEAVDQLRVKELSYDDGLHISYLQHYFPVVYPYISRFFEPTTRRRDAAIASRVLDISRRTDIASHTVLHKLQEVEDETTPNGIASELLDNAIAGIDTTGDGLCFLLYHLSLPGTADVQEKLHKELVSNPTMPLDDLPYLDAVVKEGLRCFAPIPMSLPRKVPKGGRTIAGEFVPEDTIVSCQAYTLHRLDTAVFDDAEMFVPERWLKSKGAVDRNQLFFAFSTGGRGCIGKHLALLEMKMLLKEIYTTCRTSVAPEMKASMELHDQIMSSRPKGQKCLIKFEKIE